ncbi:MAG: ferredoxin [Ammonifex sp.]|nr:MAG: ferredoxin [Ammonifex sp.]
MRVEVDQDLCIGCGTCVDLCPEVFEWVETEEKAKAVGDEVPDGLKGACREATESCPTDAITTH